MVLSQLEAALSGLARSDGSSTLARVCLISRRPRPGIVESIERLVAGVTVVPVKHVGSPSDRRRTFLASGPFDAVVDIADGRLAARMRELSPHLRQGGLWLARSDGTTNLESLSTIAEDIGFIPVPPIADCPDLLLFRQSESVLAKVREQELLEFGPRWDSTFPILEQLPPGHPATSVSTRSNQLSRIESLADSLEAPSMTVRSLDWVNCEPNGLVWKRNILLPETFNRPGRPGMNHPSLIEQTKGFAHSPKIELRRLSGSYFHLANRFQPHFGHMISEQLSRLWGWRSALIRYPDLQLLLFDSRGFIDPWQKHLLAAAGIDPSRVSVQTEACTVEHLVTASQLFSRPDYIHPALRQTLDDIGLALGEMAPKRVRPNRIFLTRLGPQRVCRNREHVEEFHQQRGFVVVIPEQLTVSEQVRLVRDADIVSGFAGSGMFQIAFAGRPKQVVAIAPDTYPAHNEHMFSRLLGHQLTVVSCRPDVPREGTFDNAAFHSDFEFDFERDGAYLSHALT